MSIRKKRVIDKVTAQRRCVVKSCKKKFTPFRDGQTVCSAECSWKYAEQLKEKKQSKPHKTQAHPELYSKENKAALGRECQKLARMIDARFGYLNCIDCDRIFGKQVDGGHFHSKGHNASIRYNLHNIHSQRSECNQNGLGGGKQLGYYEGLIKRYGQDYADYVKNELQLKYPYIGLKNHEIPEILKRVRALIRNFDTYNFMNSIHARDVCNTIIGIYKP